MAADLRTAPRLTPQGAPTAPPAMQACSYGPETVGMNKDTMQVNCQVAKTGLTGGVAGFVGAIIPGPAGKWAGTLVGNGIGGIIKCPSTPPPRLPMPALVPIPVPPARGSV